MDTWIAGRVPGGVRGLVIILFMAVAGFLATTWAIQAFA
jgi:hypothetical protein